MVILLASQKGGVGKSTLAINIAKHLQYKNKSLLIIDADRQRTISNSRFKDKFNIDRCYNNMKKKVLDHKKKYKNIVIDVEGRDSEEGRSGMLVADMVIIPFTPSQADLYSLGNISSIVMQGKQLNKKLKCYAVVNSANPHPRNKDATDAVKFIKANSKLKPMQTVLHTRNSYRDMFAYNKSIFELKDKKAILETTKLIKELGI